MRYRVRVEEVHSEAGGTHLYVAVTIEQSQYNLIGHNFT